MSVQVGSFDVNIIYKNDSKSVKLVEQEMRQVQAHVMGFTKKLSTSLSSINNGVTQAAKESKRLGTNLSSGLSKANKSLAVTSAATTKLNTNLGNIVKLGSLIYLTRVTSKLVSEFTTISAALTEVQNVIDTTFGDAASSINDFAKISKQAFGVSELAAKKFTGLFGANFKAAGIQGADTIANMSIQMAGLVGDVASFRNMSTSDVFDKFSSGLAGEVTAMRSLGVSMTVVNMEAFALTRGIHKSWVEMTNAEQQTLRYAFMIDGLKDSIGDFNKTQNTWANQTRVLSENLNQLKSIIGTGMIAVLAPVVTVLNKIIMRLSAFGSMLLKVLGVEVQTSGNATAESIGGVGDNLGDVTDEAKKATKALASFDDVVTLSSPDTSSGLDGGAGGLGSEFSSLLDDVAYDDSFFAQFGDDLQATIEEMQGKINLDKLKESFDNLKSNFTSLGDVLFGGDPNVLIDNLIKIAVNLTTIGSNTLSFLVSALETVLRLFGLSSDESDTLIEKLANLTEFMAANQWIVNAFVGSFVLTKGVLGVMALRSALVGLFTLFTASGTIGETVLLTMMVGFDKLKLFILKASGAFTTFMGSLGPLATAAFYAFVVAFADFMTGIFKTLGDMYSKMDISLWQQIKEMTVGLFEWRKDIVDDFKNTVKYITGLIKSFFDGTSKFKDIADELLLPFKLMLEDISEVFETIIDNTNILSKLPKFNFSFGSDKNNSTPKTKLANGGIVTRPTRALIGEAGREAVVPLENSSFIESFASKISNAVKGSASSSGSSNVNNINLNVGTMLADEADASKVGRFIVKAIGSYTDQIGGEPNVVY